MSARPGTAVCGAVVAALTAIALVMPPATAHRTDRADRADRAIVLPGASGTEGVARLN